MPAAAALRNAPDLLLLLITATTRPALLRASVNDGLEVSNPRVTPGTPICSILHVRTVQARWARRNGCHTAVDVRDDFRNWFVQCQLGRVISLVTIPRSLAPKHCVGARGLCVWLEDARPWPVGNIAFGRRARPASQRVSRPVDRHARPRVAIAAAERVFQAVAPEAFAAFHLERAVVSGPAAMAVARSRARPGDPAGRRGGWCWKSVFPHGPNSPRPCNVSRIAVLGSWTVRGMEAFDSDAARTLPDGGRRRAECRLPSSPEWLRPVR